MFVKKHSKGQVKSFLNADFMGLRLSPLFMKFFGLNPQDDVINKKHAFTLAEVLVTLGIIGVVSAMTIPTLTQNWQKKAYVTQLHKVYNMFSQAFVKTLNDQNALNFQEAGFTSGSNAKIKTFLHDNFKVVQDCANNYSQCFADSYRTIDGSTNFYVPSLSACYNVNIANGAAVGMNIYSADDGDSADAIGYIYVDINGKKGPNIAGRDFFVMYIYPDNNLDDEEVSSSCRASSNCAKTIRDEMFDRHCLSSGPNGCFGKILNDNWEMNY